MKNIQKMGILWGILSLVLFGGLTAFGFLYKNKSKEYKELEKKLVEAEKKYADAHFAYPNPGDTVKTDAKTLIKEGFLDHLKVKEEECDGYAIVSHESTIFEYKGYVSCNTYKTKGYEK